MTQGFDLDEIERALARSKAEPEDLEDQGFWTEARVITIFPAMIAAIRELRAEVERWHTAYEIAHDQATENGAQLSELRAENARLRKLTCATWFYMPDEGDRCWFSPHEVIDEMYDPEPGNHVFEVECATSLPSIWCAVRVTDDPDADERFTFTEHATEAEARAALGEPQ